MGRTGRGPDDSQPGSENRNAEASDFGDGATKFAQDVPAPTPRGSQSAASAAHRRASAYGGFGVTEETYDHMREKGAGGAPAAGEANDRLSTGYSTK